MPKLEKIIHVLTSTKKTGLQPVSRPVSLYFEEWGVGAKSLEFCGIYKDIDPITS